MVKEGYFSFLGYKTYYRIVGAEYEDSVPLVLLHGGPGSTHNYFEVLDPLADEGRRLIMYDQIGCGNSYVSGHPELWTAETWAQELSELRRVLNLDRIHLLGQSWGGMLAIYYLIEKKAKGVQSVILSSTLPSSKLWEREQYRLISFLPDDEKEAIYEAERSGDFTSEECKKAVEHYMKLHASDVNESSPECMRREKKFGDEAYLYGWGPNEFSPTGSLKDFDYTDRLGEIRIPSLVISGTNDLCTPLIAKTIFDGIPDSRWELFDGCRHMVYGEETERYCSLLSEWMKEHD
ncbi:MAG: proline iminopeptidase-family hydrolase [Oscillospiraceae bacterium]|nr:proline iminopeptidase-family hydrolase [Oscillospiraceae bacterium]